MTVSGPVLATGAGGFIGAKLVRRLLEHPRFEEACVVLNDRVVDQPPEDRRVRVVVRDFAGPAVRVGLLHEPPSHVVHLSGVLGGAAEADPVEASRVNVEGTPSIA